MKEALKLINECVFYNFDKVSTFDKVERINKLNNLRKILYSNPDTIHEIKLFDLIDDISLSIIDKNNNVGDNLFAARENIDKFNELRNSILNILAEQSNIEFVAQ